MPKEDIKDSSGGPSSSTQPKHDVSSLFSDPAPTEPETEEIVPEPEKVEDEDPVMPAGKANVRLAKSREKDALPKGLVNIGMSPGIIIPTTKTQLAGFYVKDAALLVAQFPQYKFIQEKGSERPVQ